MHANKLFKIIYEYELILYMFINLIIKYMFIKILIYIKYSRYSISKITEL